MKTRKSMSNVLDIETSFKYVFNRDARKTRGPRKTRFSNTFLQPRLPKDESVGTEDGKTAFVYFPSFRPAVLLFLFVFTPPPWGCKKCYLLSHQPDSGRCELQVTLFWTPKNRGGGAKGGSAFSPSQATLTLVHPFFKTFMTFH